LNVRLFPTRRDGMRAHSHSGPARRKRKRKAGWQSRTSARAFPRRCSLLPSAAAAAAAGRRKGRHPCPFPKTSREKYEMNGPPPPVRARETNQATAFYGRPGPAAPHARTRDATSIRSPAASRPTTPRQPNPPPNRNLLAQGHTPTPAQMLSYPWQNRQKKITQTRFFQKMNFLQNNFRELVEW
jgi:hypothetical protein